jgi:hypothetical protein
MGHEWRGRNECTPVMEMCARTTGGSANLACDPFAPRILSPQALIIPVDPCMSSGRYRLENQRRMLAPRDKTCPGWSWLRGSRSRRKDPNSPENMRKVLAAAEGPQNTSTPDDTRSGDREQ